MSAIPDDSQIALALYQQRAGLTDQNVQPGIEGLHLPMLGLFGEVGGLLSELKKKQRDKDSYVGYQDSVIEEFGDTLWYFTNICARAGLTLDLLAQRAMGARAATPHSFADLQPVEVGSEPHSVSSFERRALDLAAKTGILLQHFSVKSINRGLDLLTADLT